MRILSVSPVLRPIRIFIVLFLTGFVACSDDTENPTDPGNAAPKISVADITVAEGNTALFTVSLDKTATSQVTFSYFTVDSTATVPDDYTSRAGVDTIPTNEQQAVIMVSTTDDQQAEPSEYFKLIISSTSGATMADSVAVAAISDNDQQVVSYTDDVQPILRASCALVMGGCHGGTAPVTHEFTMGSDADYDSVITATGARTGGPVVIPGDTTSALYTWITINPPFGIRTNDGPPFLDTVQQRKIRDWILNGAPDN